MGKVKEAARRGNVWAVFHRAYRVGGDVVVASQRSTDLAEWERAHYGALRNMQDCQREAQRWASIADELLDGLVKLQQERYEQRVAELERS